MSVTPAPCNALTAEAGAEKTYCLSCGSGRYRSSTRTRGSPWTDRPPRAGPAPSTPAHRRVGRQPIPQVGPGGEVHVPAEGEGDGLPIALPVRIEARVPCLWWWPRCDGDPPGRGSVRRPSGSRTPGSDEDQDEGQHHEHETDPPEPPIALDPPEVRPGSSTGGTGVSAPGTGRVSRSVGDVPTL